MGYIDRNTPLTTPLSVHDVANCLGEVITDVGYLCASPLVNKWSARKPIEANHPRALSDAERYEADCGFINLSDFVGTLNTLNAVYSAGETWQYQPPLTWYRLTDFVGYKHGAKDFTPTGAITAPSGRESVVLSLSWNSELAQHIANFKAYKSASTNGKGFGLMGVFLRVDGALYFAYLGKLADNPTSCALAIDALLGAINATPYGVDAPVLAMPVLLDYGTDTTARTELQTGKLYTPDELTKTLVYAPYRALALPGKPFAGTFTPIMWRVWRNLRVMLAWSTGGYVNGTASFNGQVYLRNDNDFAIDIALFVTGSAITGELKLYGDYNNPTFVTLYAGNSITAAISRSWAPADAYASVRIGVKTKYLLNGQTIAEDADFEWKKTGEAREQVVQGSFADLVLGKIELD